MSGISLNEIDQLARPDVAQGARAADSPHNGGNDNGALDPEELNRWQGLGKRIGRAESGMPGNQEIAEALGAMANALRERETGVINPDAERAVGDAVSGVFNPPTDAQRSFYHDRFEPAYHLDDPVLRRMDARRLIDADRNCDGLVSMSEFDRAGLQIPRRLRDLRYPVPTRTGWNRFEDPSVVIREPESSAEPDGAPDCKMPLIS